MARFPRLSVFLVVLLSCGIFAHAVQPDFKCTQAGTITTCHLDQPTVNQARTEYRSVVLKPNDKVSVSAGGCVQTGGHGLTWKRYVNPSGDNSERLYHGMISIPGVTGPALVQIQSVVGKSLQVPAVIDPNNSFLVLGYQDDNYSDNGYWGHDNGTEDQCKDPVQGKPAWITMIINHGGPPQVTAAAPMDVVWDPNKVDPNYMPFNPMFAYEQADPGQHPDPGTLCGGFKLVPGTDQVNFGAHPCTSQSPTVNDPGSWSLNSALCGHHATSGTLDGHLNYTAATFSGIIQWDNHKDWTKLDDDDYNFNFYPDTMMGLTTNNITNFHDPIIETEFDSDETVDLIDKGWWDTFHKAVDANGGEPGGRPGQMIDSHRSIIIGQYGLDAEHGGYSELHPVYGMAIEVQEGVTSDDQWSFLVRNWGDEGYCSQGSVTLPGINTLSFMIPMPGATAVSADMSGLFQTHTSGGTSYTPKVAVRSVPNGALITFDIGPPEARTLVNGLVHFAWTIPSGKSGPVVAQAVKRTLAPRTAENEGPTQAVNALLAGLPAAGQASLKAKLVKPSQAVVASQPVQRVANIAVPPRSGPVKGQIVANPRKASLDLVRGKALCNAYNGKVPNATATLCTSLK